jgi:hypothetical protein
MSSSYGLDILTSESQYRRVCRWARIRPDASPRAFVRIREFGGAALPQLHELHELAGRAEEKLPALAELGIPPGQVVAWVEAEVSAEQYEIHLDPLLLSRLSQESLAFSLTLTQSASAELLRPVSVTGLAVEQPPGSHAGNALVSLSDGSYWSARLMTLGRLRKLLTLASAQRQGQDVGFWLPNTLFLDRIHEERVGQVVRELLHRRTFEQAFSLVEERDEGSASALDLQVLYEQRLPETVDLLLALEGRVILNQPHIWTLRSFPAEGQPLAEALRPLLALLHHRFGDLEQIGIRRQDIQISYEHRYQGSARQELSPGLMGELSRSGIPFAFRGRYDLSQVARSLA